MKKFINPPIKLLTEYASPDNLIGVSLYQIIRIQFRTLNKKTAALRFCHNTGKYESENTHIKPVFSYILHRDSNVPRDEVMRKDLVEKYHRELTLRLLKSIKEFQDNLN